MRHSSLASDSLSKLYPGKYAVDVMIHCVLRLDDGVNVKLTVCTLVLMYPGTDVPWY